MAKQFVRKLYSGSLFFTHKLVILHPVQSVACIEVKFIIYFMLLICKGNYVFLSKTENGYVALVFRKTIFKKETVLMVMELQIMHTSLKIEQTGDNNFRQEWQCRVIISWSFFQFTYLLYQKSIDCHKSKSLMLILNVSVNNLELQRSYFWCSLRRCAGEKNRCISN